MNNKQAKAIIEEYKTDTAYYNGYTSALDSTTTFLNYNEMYDFFRGRCGMGKAETMCIIASLKLSGAKFTGDLTKDY